MIRFYRWFAPLVLVGALLPAAPLPAAAAGDEVAGYEYFHTYAEVKQLIDDKVAAHPTIAAPFALSDYATGGDTGKSYEGREIWGIRITNNVGSNPTRPAIFVNGLIHARERAGEELAIYAISVLVDNYGLSTKLGKRVTKIVNTRDIYIVPMVNVDGAEYDFSGGMFHKWRKNRQPTVDNYIGIDLNRQFGYTWNCCKGGSSGNPWSDYYRGEYAWEAPEDVAYRDFVSSLADRGHPLTEILSLHSAARLVLWPYSYTTEKIPPDMQPDDHAAFVAIGRHMAALNGYTPEQGSHLYIVAGDQDDWAYGVHGIFAFTIEMPKGSQLRYYPTEAELNAWLPANRGAVLYLFEQADCPYRAAGLASTHC